jgi:thymidylate synthase (FAD)
VGKSLVTLVGITQPQVLTQEFAPQQMTPEQFIAYCARVSNPSNQNNLNSDGLLRYCIANQHWSVFEMINVVMEIRTTRDIARQILRHDNHFQEFSQRYASPRASDFITDREARLQDTKNRQNSIEVNDPKLQQEFEHHQKAIVDHALKVYNWAIEKGIAKEQARVVLPEGLTPSMLYMNGSLRNYIHYCDLRRGNGTQKEHREIADSVWQILCQNFNFLKEYKREDPLPPTSSGGSSDKSRREKLDENYAKNNASKIRLSPEEQKQLNELRLKEATSLLGDQSIGVTSKFTEPNLFK